MHIPRISILDETGASLDDDQRAPHTVTEFFRLNCFDAAQRAEAYDAWREHEPFIIGGGAAPIFYVSLVEPPLDEKGSRYFAASEGIS